MAYINPLSNMSYTNRDFNTVYPELLNLVKTLTYKWDPSISNESDPGVVLLKLNALIADKCNYNMDKNVLECFPLSVSQDANARQLYSQLGYYMHWHRSATTTVNMVWKDTSYINDSNYYCTIPKFTMVSDYDNTVVYTLLGPASSLGAISDQNLILDGSTLSWTAIQGIAVKYEINGETTITADMLDKDNRIYFLTNDVAENGIFITHAGGQNDYNLWKKKDNLLVEQTVFDEDVDTIVYNYSFGVLPNSNTCYLEFPENAIEMFNNGINITYIKTNAASGDIPYNLLEKFETDLTVSTNYEGGTTMVLNTENTKMLNVTAGSGGQDKETLNGAYKGFKRTIGTYNTLVTLRDYINACLTSGEVSNGFVTSRQDDIQCEYTLMTTVEGTNTKISKLDAINISSINPSLTAFNLKFYLTKFVNATITNAKDYNETYKLMNETELQGVKQYIESKKSLEHDYTSILTPYTYISSSEEETSKFRSHVCMFINKFPIETRIISKHPLTLVEKEEVINNIKKAFYKSLSAKNLEFGVAPNNLEIKSIIEEADPRVADVNVYDLTYETIAVYWNGEDFVEVNLSKPMINVAEYREKKKADPNHISEVDYNLEYKVSCTDPFSIITPAYDINEETGEYVDKFKSTVNNNVGWGLYKFKYLGDFDESQKWVWWKYLGSGEFKEEWENLPAGTTYETFFTNNHTGRVPIGTIVTIEINPVEFVKEEILAKSILAGVTPLLEEDNKLGFDVDQTLIKQEVLIYDEATSSYNLQDVAVVGDVYKIKSSCSLEVKPTTDRAEVLKLKEHENLQFFAPNLISGNSYSNYVKFEYVITGSDTITRIPKNAAYQLRDNEYILFYWKDTDYEDSVYQYHAYGPGFIFTPTFDIPLPMGESDVSSTSQELIHTMGPGGIGESEISSEWYHDLSTAQSEVIERLTGDRYYLSNTKEITMKQLNIIELDNKAKIYWILNESFKDKYVLFEENQKDIDPYTGAELDHTSYILNSGEYFIYANSSLSEIVFLGAGSKIIRYNDFRKWEVDTIPRATITDKGGAALESYWFPLENSTSMKLVEQQYYNIGEGCSIKSKVDTYTFTEEAQELARNEEIKYTSVEVYTEEDWVSLPVMLLNNNVSTAWSGRSNLTLNVGPNMAQQIEGNHTIYFCTTSHDPEEAEPIYEIHGADSTSPEYPKMLKLSHAINSSETSGYSSTIEIDDNGLEEFANLYVYTRSIDTDKVKYRTSGGASLYFLKEERDPSTMEIQVSFSFAVPTSSKANTGYLLPLYNPYGDLDKLVCTITDIETGISTPVHILNKEDTQFADPRLYFLELQLEEDKKYTLTFTLHGAGVAEDRVITLNKFFKYEVNPNIVPLYNRICELFETSFDTEGLFNYTYSVPESQIIENPLDPKSFLDVNHIYNKFTICKLDVSNQLIKIFGGTD